MTHVYFLSVILKISLCCMTFCSSNESKSSIILDVTDQIEDSRYSRENIDSTIQSFMKQEQDTLIENNQPIVLYYEHFFRNGTYALKTIINRIKLLRSHFRLLLSIKEHTNLDHENDIATYSRNRYSDIISIIAENLFISGVSFEFIDVRNTCSVNSPVTNTTLIEELQQLLRSFTAHEPKIGYELNFNQLACTGHSRYIKSSNFLIIKYHLKRNDKFFVESFDVFKSSMKQFGERVKNLVQILFDGNYTRPVHYKLTLRTNLNLENTESSKCVKGHVTSDGQKIIEMASENIVNVQDGYMNKYETLLAQYCHQLKVDGQDVKFILKLLPVNSNTLQALVIPQMPTLPVMGLGTSGMRSISFLLEEIASSGSNTIMINGEIWQEMIKKGISKSNCPNERCRPENVWYLNDKDYAFSNYNKNSIKTLLEVDGMHLKALVFSRYYNDKAKFNWIKAVESLRLANHSPVMIKTGCTELTDIFGEILHNGTFGIYCHSWLLQRVLGCGSLNRSSNIIVWRGVLVVNVYTVNDFVDNTIKKLDALVLGRQILQNRRNNNRQNKKVEIVLRIKIEYGGKGKTVIGNHMYCTELSANIYQLYEILLTWATIHDFTIILKPISGEFGYDNPISWKRLEISATGRMRNLITLFPIFIRRSYNTSRVFGSWTRGMYPCIQQSKNLDFVKVINFTHPSTGATIYINVRTGNADLSIEELQIMLLYAFGKFSTIEIIIRSQSELQILYDTVTQNDFDKNLKTNNVSQKHVHIGVSISLSQHQIEIMVEIVKVLEHIFFQVQIHHPKDQKAELFNFTKLYSSSGMSIENCTETAYDILTSHYDVYDKIRTAKYIVCNTSPKLAQNEDTSSMRDYLDSHLYLKKLFQYFFRNLSGVYFRLHPRLVGNTFQEQSENLLLFLADIHKYADAYGINYFLLPVLPPETEEKTASFWTVRNYANLSDINSFIERQANLSGLANWKPKLVNQSETNFLSSRSTSTDSLTPFNSSSFTTEISKKSTGHTAEVDDTTMLSTQHKSNSTSQQATSFENLLSSNYLYVTISAFLIVILVLCTVSIKIFRNRRYLTTKEVTDFLHGRRETLEDAVVKRKRETSRNFNVFDGLLYQKDYEISTENIKLDKKPGSIIFKGKFSKVYLGKLLESTNDVLVEICNERISKSYFIAMLSEVKMLCYIGRHGNIVDFIGAYTEEIQQGVLWIVKEFCQKGSLHEYLQLVKDDIRSQTLIRFAKEISAGMDYLSCQHVVHGDLRTKNVFLDTSNKTCKIGNFGTTRTLLEYRLLTKKGKYNLLPWRWMAYETLQNLELSIYSDVWSYGVTIWEILSTGNLPYGEDVVDKATVIKMLKEGTRLECPIRASSATYQIMTQCWTLDSKHRPDFPNLTNFFTDLLSTFKEHSAL